MLPSCLNSLPKQALLSSSPALGSSAEWCLLSRYIGSACHLTLETLGPSRVKLVFCLRLFAMGPKASSKKRRTSGFEVELGGPFLTIRPYSGPAGLRRSTPPPPWASERPERASLSKASAASLLEAWKELPPSLPQPGGGERRSNNCVDSRHQGSLLQVPNSFQFLWLVEGTWPLEQKDLI